MNTQGSLLSRRRDRDFPSLRRNNGGGGWGE